MTDSNVFSIGNLIIDILSKNWSLIVGVFVAFLAIKTLKAGLQIALVAVFAGITVTLLTYLGIIPPFAIFMKEVATLVGLS